MEENKNRPEIQVSDTPETKSEPVKNEQTIEKKGKAKLSALNFLKKCFSTNNLRKTIAVILLVVIVAGTIVGIVIYNSPKSVALRFVKAHCEFDLKAEEKLLAYDNRTLTLCASGCKDDEEEFFESRREKYEETINSWGDYFKVYREQELEDMEDSYGDYKYTYRVSKIKDVSKRKVEDENGELLSSLEAQTNFDADRIEKCKTVIIKVKLDSEDIGIVRRTAYVTLVKVSNSWKVLNYKLSK